MNLILNNFEDCFYIDVSTKTYSKKILIDKDIYEELKARGLKISLQGGIHPVIHINKKPQYLQRYVMNNPTEGVINHKDGLHVDFRRSNLIVTPHRIKKRINKSLRAYYIESIKRLGHLHNDEEGTEEDY